MAEMLIGTVTHYWSRIGVAGIDLEAPLHTGEQVRIVGHTTDLKQVVESMEINNRRVDAAEAGSDVAIKVIGKVREGDKVYRELESAGSGEQ